MRYFSERYKEFRLEDWFEAKLSDQVLLGYVAGNVSAEEMREHVKLEEQKWIRKAKKYVLYDDQPYRGRWLRRGIRSNTEGQNGAGEHRLPQYVPVMLRQTVQKTKLSFIYFVYFKWSINKYLYFKYLIECV